jgi:hypothetical protein
MEGMGKVTGFELMAGHASFLADGFGIQRERIVGDMRSGEARCRSRYTRDRREPIA